MTLICNKGLLRTLNKNLAKKYGKEMMCLGEICGSDTSARKTAADVEVCERQVRKAVLLPHQDEEAAMGASGISTAG